MASDARCPREVGREEGSPLSSSREPGHSTTGEICNGYDKGAQQLKNEHYIETVRQNVLLRVVAPAGGEARALMAKIRAQPLFACPVFFLSLLSVSLCRSDDEETVARMATHMVILSRTSLGSSFRRRHYTEDYWSCFMDPSEDRLSFPG